MEIKSTESSSFVKYGKIIEDFDFSELFSELEKKEKPLDSVLYIPSDEDLEKLNVFKDVQKNVYGGMPIQFGYCNGHNKKLNCLEYHRGSEVNIVLDEIILLLAPLQDLKNNKIDASKIEAFLVKEKTAVLLYETSLHYAPVSSDDNGFRVVIVLPKDTNTEKPSIELKNEEDKLLWAKNKWLVAHADTSEAGQGAFVGIEGKNIEID